MTRHAFATGHGHQTNLLEMRQQLVSLSERVNELAEDIRFIKDIFLAKQAKKTRRREKKEQERQEAERQRRAYRLRSEYEDVIWAFKHRWWEYMPPPQCALSPKELELVSLLTKYTDEQIAIKMDLEKSSVNARLCVIRQRLEVTTRQKLIDFYSEYESTMREHKHRKCFTLLAWLLNPPPGVIHQGNLQVVWLRRLGRGREFHYAGPHVPDKVFRTLRRYEDEILKLLARDFSIPEIASRLKLKDRTVISYLSEIRSSVKRETGGWLSTIQLKDVYNDYLRRERKRARLHG